MNLTETIQRLGYRFANEGKTIIVGDDAETQAIYAEMRETQEKMIDPRARNELLCKTQLRVNALGHTAWSLGSNMYGWAVGSTMRSNIMGGRWAVTPRGLTVEQAIEAGLRKAERKNHTFSFSVEHLPEDVRRELGVEVAA